MIRRKPLNISSSSEQMEKIAIVRYANCFRSATRGPQHPFVCSFAPSSLLRRLRRHIYVYTTDRAYHPFRTGLCQQYPGGRVIVLYKTYSLSLIPDDLLRSIDGVHTLVTGDVSRRINVKTRSVFFPSARGLLLSSRVRNKRLTSTAHNARNA